MTMLILLLGQGLIQPLTVHLGRMFRFMSGASMCCFEVGYICFTHAKWKTSPNGGWVKQQNNNHPSNRTEHATKKLIRHVDC